MLRYRKFPAVEQLTQLAQNDQKACDEARGAMMRDYFASPAAQIIAHVMQELETSALERLRQGQRPEYYCGQMAALDALRSSLVALLPDHESEGIEGLTPEAEEPFFETSVYESGFDIPFKPSGE